MLSVLSLVLFLSLAYALKRADAKLEAVGEGKLRLYCIFKLDTSTLRGKVIKRVLFAYAKYKGWRLTL
jgi:hypothetical protein